MPNLRIIYDNAADRAASITASNTSGTLVASNMLVDRKGTVHRSIGLTVSYSLTWSSQETIGGVSLPATNLSKNATIRVRLYSDTGLTSLVADSGTLLACPNTNNTIHGWDQVVNANSFAYGGYSKTSVWFSTQHLVRGCIIDIVDTTNLSGFIDCARIVCGKYWEPKRHVQNGSLNLEFVDLSTSERLDSGDLIASRGPCHDRLSFNLAYLDEVDRQTIFVIAKKAGKVANVLVCIFPDNTNSTLAQDSLIYGKVTGYATSQQLYGYYNLPLEIEGW